MKSQTHVIGLVTPAKCVNTHAGNNLFRNKVVGITKAAFLLVTLLFATAGVFAQPKGPCGCENKADLINQLNLANAALKRIAQFRASAKATDMANDLMPAPNPRKLKWQWFIDNEINVSKLSVQDRNANIVQYDTDPDSCQSTTGAETDCLKTLAAKLPPYLGTICKSAKIENVSDYLSALSDLYEFEIGELLKILRALPTSCRPGGWFGTIMYIETRIVNSKQSKPGSVETSNDTFTRTGTIALKGAPDQFPVVKWEVSGGGKETKDTSSTMYCTASDRFAKKATGYQTEFRKEYDRTGAVTINTSVDIGDPEEGNRIAIGFTVPPIDIMIKGSTTDSRSSGCPNDSFSNTMPLSADSRFESSRINFSASYFPGDPEKISGSDNLDNLPPIKSDTMTMSSTVQVIYNLYRIVK